MICVIFYCQGRSKTYRFITHNLVYTHMFFFFVENLIQARYWKNEKYAILRIKRLPQKFIKK